MEKSIKLIDQFEIRLSPFISETQARVLRYTLYFAISFFLPLGLLLLNADYTSAQGTTLESCCDGSGMSFGFLTGILLAIFMRFDKEPQGAANRNLVR